jgi:hypothetical protein
MDTAGTGRRFVFSKPYPIHLILVSVTGTRVWVRGYLGTRVGGSGMKRVDGSNVITVQ